LAASARRRAPLVLAVAGLLILGVVLTVALLRGGGTQAPPSQVDSLVRIDPATNERAATIPVGARPSGVAVTEDVVWLLSSDERSVSIIDAATNTPLRTITVDRPTDVTVGAGAAWVVSFVDGTLTKLDDRTGDLREKIELGANVSATSVAIGEGATWVANAAVVGNEYTVIRIPSARGSAIVTIPLHGRPVDVGVGAGAVWVATGGVEPALSRIDPATNRVTTTIALPFTPEGIALGEGAVWISNRGDDSILRLDALTNRITATIGVGKGPTGIAVGDGSVWVANGLDRTVSRVDPDTGKVVATIDVGSRPDDVAANGRGVWVTVRAQ
jgi:YVTN family beta-propeller protein